MVLPSPSALLGVGNFNSWRPGQDTAFSAVMTWLSSDSRHLCVSMPTGSGKSLLAALGGKMSGKRCVILTATKGLQAQIMHDFKDIGIVDIRGQNSFSCNMDNKYRADEGPCRDGFKCEFRSGGCDYYDRLKAARESQFVVTNYAYWLAQTNYTDEGLGDVDILVLDEAHMAFSALESFLAVSLYRSDIESSGGKWPQEGFDTWEEWQSWAYLTWRRAENELASLKAEAKDIRDVQDHLPSALSNAIRRITKLTRNLQALVTARGHWAWEKQGTSWYLAPVWPGLYSDVLFHDSEKIMAMSAILTQKTANSIGILDSEWISLPSYFPREHTPIYHIPTVRLNFRSTPVDVKAWVTRIDQIIDRREGKKGIVFTVSYARRNQLLQQSRHRDSMISHATKDVVAMVNHFKAASPPAVFVSPSITSGWDFPGTDCLVPGTQVRTSKGYRPIEGIGAGDLVFTGAGRFCKVVTSRRRYHNGDVVCIKSAGNIVHKMTPEHPVLVTDWRGEQRTSRHWVNAGDLTEDHVLVMPVGGRKLGAKPLGQKYLSGHRVSGQKVPNQWTDDANFWWLVGVYAAEGSISSESAKRTTPGAPRIHKSIWFTFSEGERGTLALRTTEAIHTALGNKQPPIYKHPSRYSCSVCVKNNAFAVWLENNVGRGSASKRVPQRLMDSGNYVNMRAFIDGLLAGDGHFNKYGQWEMVLASPNLLYGSRDMLLQIGQVVSVGTKIIDGKTYYKLATTKGRRRDRLSSNMSGSWLTTRPKITREHYDGLVYNLQVAEDESYCLLGMCVHNCEYIVVGKLPYPDTRSPIMKARSADDPEWTSFMAMETMIQEAGRGTRSASDRCEVFVIDDSISWFIQKYGKFAPDWFMERYRGRRDTIPL